MIKNLILPLAATCLFILLVGLLIQGKLGIKFKPATPIQKTVLIGENKINVEVAKTDEERRMGLSGRTSLDDGSGMIFLFNDGNQYPAFWMKETQIPLDIIWIANDKVVQIDKNVPVEKDVSDENLKRYTCSEPVSHVLEVNAGYSDKIGIKVSDSVQMQFDL